jgi:5-methylcytosine-specific restriction endonuclease McrA
VVHPNSRQAKAARRRRTRVAAADNDLTAAEWALLQDLWGACAYCGATDRPLQRDCVQPIARGGRYTIDNVVPACGSCNASKSNSEVTSWMRRTRRDERAFLERLVVVRAALASAPSAG